jgi:hypothetical protein
MHTVIHFRQDFPVLLNVKNLVNLFYRTFIYSALSHLKLFRDRYFIYISLKPLGASAILVK